MLLCLCIVGLSLPCSVGTFAASVRTQNADSAHLDFLMVPEAAGWSLTIWNYGTKPAFLIHWKIETKGINGTRVLDGDRQGMLLCLRPKDTQFMMPLTLPKSKIIFPIGNGEVEITVRVTCRSLDYDATYSNHWLIRGMRLYPIQRL